jgi:hypothetical protein
MPTLPACLPASSRGVKHARSHYWSDAAALGSDGSGGSRGSCRFPGPCAAAWLWLRADGCEPGSAHPPESPGAQPGPRQAHVGCLLWGSRQHRSQPLPNGEDEDGRPDLIAEAHPTKENGAGAGDRKCRSPGRPWAAPWRSSRGPRPRQTAPALSDRPQTTRSAHDRE